MRRASSRKTAVLRAKTSIKMIILRQDATLPYLPTFADAVAGVNAYPRACSPAGGRNLHPLRSDPDLLFLTSTRMPQIVQTVSPAQISGTPRFPVVGSPEDLSPFVPSDLRSGETRSPNAAYRDSFFRCRSSPPPLSMASRARPMDSDAPAGDDVPNMRKVLFEEFREVQQDVP